MKPIIMSTEDVRGILDGRKTMTRLVAKELDGVDILNCRHVDGDIQEPKGYPIGHVSLTERCKFKPGDVLWVRETWRVGAWDDAGSICVDYKADGFTRREWIRISDPNLYEELWQQSSDDARKANASIDDDGNYNWDPGKSPTRWRSPVTMPREAARLFLRVTDVRVERLNQITNNDILREGFRSESCNICVHDGGSGCEHCFAILNPFRKSWDVRNAKRGYGWDSNPLVWVIEFERVEKGAES